MFGLNNGGFSNQCFLFSFNPVYLFSLLLYFVMITTQSKINPLKVYFRFRKKLFIFTFFLSVKA